MKTIKINTDYDPYKIEISLDCDALNDMFKIGQVATFSCARSSYRVERTYQMDGRGYFKFYFIVKEIRGTARFSCDSYVEVRNRLMSILTEEARHKFLADERERSKK